MRNLYAQIASAQSPNGGGGLISSLSRFINNMTQRGDDFGAVAETLFLSQDWQLRKVESLRFLEGLHGRRRVSVDCVINQHKGLHYDHVQRRLGTGQYLIVPITFVRKGGLRQFDATVDGSPVSVLGRREGNRMTEGVLLHEIGDAVLPGMEDALLEVVKVIVDADPSVAGLLATNLLADGTAKGIRVLNPDKLTYWAHEVISEAVDSYILIFLLPRSLGGSRTLIKYSHHWNLDHRQRSIGSRVKAAFGFIDFIVDLELSYPAGSSSHHLEVVLPDGTEGRLLQMPTSDSEDIVERNTLDTGPTGVLHGVSHYLRNSYVAEGAEVGISPARSTQQLTLVVLLCTSIALALGRWLPGGQEAMLAASDGAATILLALPAVVIALIVRADENRTAAVVLAPLRAAIIGCALMLVACAASIMGELEEGLRLILWAGGAIVTGISAALLGVGMGRGRTRERKMRGLELIDSRGGRHGAESEA